MFTRDIGYVKSGAFTLRSKMRRALLLIPLVVVVTLVGCGENHSGETQLTMVVTQSSRGHVSRAVFHLSCQPPRGDFPSPTRSCTAVEKNPKIVSDPKPVFGIGCIGTEDRVTISGWINGRSVRSDFTSYFARACGWTYSMPLVRAGLYGAFVYQAFQGQRPPGGTSSPDRRARSSGGSKLVATGSVLLVQQMAELER